MKTHPVAIILPSSWLNYSSVPQVQHEPAAVRLLEDDHLAVPTLYGQFSDLARTPWPAATSHKSLSTAAITVFLGRDKDTCFILFVPALIGVEFNLKTKRRRGDKKARVPRDRLLHFVYYVQV